MVYCFKNAGLEKTRNFGVTDEEWFKNLEEVWTRIGRQPHYDDLQKPLSKYPACSYAHRFGSWRKALVQFIEFVNKEEASSLEIRTPSSFRDHLTQGVAKKHKTQRSISWRMRFIVMKRDNFKCKKCGRSPATNPKIVLHVDHKKPWTKGGETVFENLQTLCSVCNIGKGDLTR